MDEAGKRHGRYSRMPFGIIDDVTGALFCCTSTSSPINGVPFERTVASCGAYVQRRAFFLSKKTPDDIRANEQRWRHNRKKLFLLIKNHKKITFLGKNLYIYKKMSIFAGYFE